jgi:hypothetical protein
MKTKKAIYLVSIFSILIFFVSCNVVKDISKMMTNLQRCQFKLENINNFRLSGIELSKFNKLTDLNLLDGAKLLNSFRSKKLPTEFTLNVAAINPNDGTSGTAKTKSTLTSFAWTLILDNVLTIKGNIANPIEIPETGQKSIIPLSIGLDLYEFFASKGYESIINLALALGGVNGSTSKVVLRAKPTISTPIGPITYPGEIDIIDKEFKAG